MINNSAFATGISGSGKYHLQRTLQLPFLGNVKTSNLRNVIRNIDLHNLQFPKQDHHEDIIDEFEKPKIVPQDVLGQALYNQLTTTTTSMAS